MLGLHVGALVIAPPNEATADQLRLVGAVMRRLYDLATHLAILAVDATDDLDPGAAHIR